MSTPKATSLIVVMAPIHVISEQNARCHFMVKARRVAAHREIAALRLRGQAKPTLPCTVTLTRIGAQDLDGDNLQGGFKATRDGVADWLGIDDGDKRVTWAYAQRRGGRSEYTVEIRIESEVA